MRKESKGQILIKKSNKLVEARYRLDIWETRVFTKAISMIKKDDSDLKEYRIYLSDLIKEFGLSKGLSYKFLKQGAESLNDRTIRIVRETPTGLREFKTKIVTGVDSAVDENESSEEGLYIEVSFHNKLKNELIALRKEFTTYDIRNVVGLPSTYSYRMYELLKQYEKIGERKFPLEDLKKTVGAIEIFADGITKDHYPKYGNFRQKVLLKAQRDLKKYTDISFEFEPHRKGRKYNEIQFTISKNQPIREETTKQQEKPQKEDKRVHILYDKIKDWQDITEASVRKLATKYGIDRLHAAYGQTSNDMKNKNIESPGKYFYALVHHAPTLFEEVQEKSKRNEERKKEEEKKRKLLKKLEDQRDDLNNQIREMKSTIYDDIKTDDVDTFEEMKEIVKVHNFYKKDLSFEENLERKPFYSIPHMTLAKLVPEKYKEVDELQKVYNDLRKKIDRIK